MATDTQTRILTDLSEEIMHSLVSFEDESRFPGANADEMDDRLKHHKTRANKLREIRMELEDIFSVNIR